MAPVSIDIHLNFGSVTGARPMVVMPSQSGVRLHSMNCQVVIGSNPQ